MITEGNCKGNTAADFVFWTGAGNAPSSSVRIHSAQQHHFGRRQPRRQPIPPLRRLHRHRQKEKYTKTQLWLFFPLLFFFSSSIRPTHGCCGVSPQDWSSLRFGSLQPFSCLLQENRLYSSLCWKTLYANNKIIIIKKGSASLQ